MFSVGLVYYNNGGKGSFNILPIHHFDHAHFCFLMFFFPFFWEGGGGGGCVWKQGILIAMVFYLT